MVNKRTKSKGYCIIQTFRPLSYGQDELLGFHRLMLQIIERLTWGGAEEVILSLTLHSTKADYKILRRLSHFVAQSHVLVVVV